MNKNRPTCEHCIFQIKDRCHRFPPQIWYDPDDLGGLLKSEQPYVDVETHWCGEFKSKGAWEDSDE